MRILPRLLNGIANSLRNRHFALAMDVITYRLIIRFSLPISIFNGILGLLIVRFQIRSGMKIPPDLAILLHVLFRLVQLHLEIALL